MRVYQIRPLNDPRWTRFLERQPHASVFHTGGWLEALRRTYGYESEVYTTTPPGSELQCGIVFCRIENKLTGRRLVSLPFSDHCEPLVENPNDSQAILAEVSQEMRERRLLDYIEIRPVVWEGAIAEFSCSSFDYISHRLDLRPSLGELFSALHKDSTQRKIRRAERERLRYEAGRSECLLIHFYQLLIETRRRRGVPPQPLKWFRNLIDCLREVLVIRVAYKDARPIASVLTLQCKDVLLYKYGCSDANFHRLGGVQFLLWRSIEEAKSAELRTFDLGRSDIDNAGLILFKDRWGTLRSRLRYSRYTASLNSHYSYRRGPAPWHLQLVKRILRHAPAKLLSRTGEALYKYIG